MTSSRINTTFVRHVPYPPRQGLYLGAAAEASRYRFGNRGKPQAALRLPWTLRVWLTISYPLRTTGNATFEALSSFFGAQLSLKHFHISCTPTVLSMC